LPGAVGEFSRRLAVSNAQAMICALMFNEILSGLPGTVVAFLGKHRKNIAHTVL
jgi:hypothetical protein